MIEVCPLDDLPSGSAVRVVPPSTSGGSAVPLAVFNEGGELFAIDDTCTHQDASLSEGYVEDCRVECPLHASTFDLRTGAVDGPPARLGVRTHTVEVRDGVVWVEPEPRP